jgi:hypothetical protein
VQCKFAIIFFTHRRLREMRKKLFVWH